MKNHPEQFKPMLKAAKEASALYQNFFEEYVSAKSIIQELVWLAKHVNPKSGVVTVCWALD